MVYFENRQHRTRFLVKITSESSKHYFKKSRDFILHRLGIHRKTFSTYSPRVATESLNSIRKPNADFTSLHFLMCCHQRTNESSDQTTPNLANILWNQPNRRTHLSRNTDTELGIQVRIVVRSAWCD